MSTAATAAPLPHPLVTAIDARHSPGPPSPSKEVTSSLVYALVQYMHVTKNLGIHLPRS